MTKTHYAKFRMTEAQFDKLMHHAFTRNVTLTQVLIELVDALPEEPIERTTLKIVYEKKRSK